ncbi:MAG: hypothetical protein HYY85_09705 [Deltaproteobacteria bacterium]|nr:hypothetical protein [Deltaproteobacteria bacterium]
MRIQHSGLGLRPRRGLRSLAVALTFGMALGSAPEVSADLGRAFSVDFTTPVNLSNDKGKARESRIDQEDMTRKRARGRKAKRMGSHIYVAWQDRNTANGKEDIYFRFSTDGGVTWNPAVDPLNPTLSVSPMNLSSDSSVSTEPRLDADGRGSVYIVWQDVTSGKVKFRRLLIAGSTAIPLAAHDLNQGPVAGTETLPDLVLDDKGRVHAAWVQGGVVYYSRSTDQGITFEQPVAVSGASTSTLEAEIAVDGKGRASLVWQDGAMVLYNRVVDGVPGATPIDIGMNAIADAGPTVAVGTGGQVHVTWIGTEPGAIRTFYTQSRDGERFSEPLAMRPDTVRGLMGMGKADKARILAWGERGVALVWFEKVASGQTEIFVARSQNGGRSFEGTQVSASTASRPNSADPRMAVDQAGHVHVAWRQGNGSTVDDVMYARELPGRLEFSAPELLSCPDNTTTCPGVSSRLVSPKNDDPVPDVDVNGNVHIVYDSNEGGTKRGDIFFVRSRRVH